MWHQQWKISHGHWKNKQLHSHLHQTLLAMADLPEGVACVGWSELFKLPKPDEVSELPELGHWPLSFNSTHWVSTQLINWAYNCQQHVGKYIFVLDMINLPEGVACVGWSELFKLPKPDEVSELPELERCKSLEEEPLSVSRLISIVRTLPFVLVLVWSCLQIWFSFPELELGGPTTAGPVVILELLELLRICFLLRSVPRKIRARKKKMRTGVMNSYMSYFKFHRTGGE